MRPHSEVLEGLSGGSRSSNENGVGSGGGSEGELVESDGYKRKRPNVSTPIQPTANDNSETHPLRRQR